MTEKLYYQDSHMSDFEAKVISCQPNGGESYNVILDKTAFFPEGGGQMSDRGTVSCGSVSAAVGHVFENEQGDIIHVCSAPLPKGSTVRGIIDFETRFRRMQNHSGEHIISGIAHRLFGCENVGFHMGSEDITIDFDRELDAKEIDTLEREANTAVWKNVRFYSRFPSPEESQSIDFRSKKEISGQVRLVVVEGYDICACCAPHVSRSGEIGLIKILNFIRYKGGVRLHVLCGRDAYEYIGEICGQNAEISHTLSAKPLETAEAVCRLSEQNAAARTENTRLLSVIAARRTEQMKLSYDPGKSRNITVFENELDNNGLRALANAGAELASNGLCAVFCGQDGGYRYIIASRAIDLRAASKEINTALSGRGGGSPDMIQGSAACSRERIVKYFE